MRVRLSTLAAVVLLGVTLIAGTATAGTRVLRVQTSQLAGFATLKYQIEKLVPLLKEMSGGQLEIQLLPINAVVPYKDSLDATSKGILDGVFAVLQHFSGVDAGYALISDPIAAFDTPEQNQMFCEFGGGVQLVQEMHNKYFPGIHVVLCGPYSREALVSGKPIRKVDDFKGVKIRAPEGLAAEVFRRAGATPVTLPPSEVYTSLEKKIIDAADMSTYENNNSSGLHKIAKFPIYPGIHSQPVQHLAFNQKVWDSLTPAQRRIIDVWGYTMLVSMTRFADMEDRQVVARDKAGQGVKGIEIINWPQEERDKLRSIAEGAWKDFAKKSEFAKKVYDVHVEFFKRMGML